MNKKILDKLIAMYKEKIKTYEARVCEQIANVKLTIRYSAEFAADLRSFHQINFEKEMAKHIFEEADKEILRLLNESNFR